MKYVTLLCISEATTNSHIFQNVVSHMNLCGETIKSVDGHLGFMQINVNNSFGFSYYLGDDKNRNN